ncbi:MAG: RluA family pseudouridine synthase [Clostridia bacterium]
MKLTYCIQKKDTYTSVKEVLLSQFKISKRLLTKLKQTQSIYRNDTICTVSQSVTWGDTICVSFEQIEDTENIVPIHMPLSILYEDECYLVINKPAGIPVHPSCYHYEDSLSNGVRYYFDSIGLLKKIRPVNRIDRDTTGLVIFAKNEYVQESLIRQMHNGQFQKEYLTIVEGIFTQKQGSICAPIARKARSIMERQIDASGQQAITHYQVIQESYVQNFPISIVSCQLETGRTHQIRVHMAYCLHPLLGDTLYGLPSPLINRQALHSYKCCFYHPIHHQLVEYTAPIPKDMQCFFNNN